MGTWHSHTAVARRGQADPVMRDKWAPSTHWQSAHPSMQFLSAWRSQSALGLFQLTHVSWLSDAAHSPREIYERRKHFSSSGLNLKLSAVGGRGAGATAGSTPGAQHICHAHPCGCPSQSRPTNVPSPVSSRHMVQHWASRRAGGSISGGVAPYAAGGERTRLDALGDSRVDELALRAVLEHVVVCAVPGTKRAPLAANYSTVWALW